MISVYNNKTWGLAALFMAILFVKTMLFHWFTIHSLLISSIFHAPIEFFMFWFGKVVPVIFFGSLLFFTKRQWWTIIVNIFIDLWCIANLFYFKANTIFLSTEMIGMADNMTGFWDSLSTYMGWDISSFVLLTIFYVAIYFIVFRKNNYIRQPLVGVCGILLVLILNLVGNILYAQWQKRWSPQTEAARIWLEKDSKNEKFTYFYPFGNAIFWATIERCLDASAWATSYVRTQSIISYFPSALVYYAFSPKGEYIPLTELERTNIEKLLHIETNGDSLQPNQNIIFILFESLESWPINTKIDGFDYLPNISQLTQSNHILYCPYLKSQTKHGNSADGQMIAVTGLLPITSGATCRLYGHNSFPNYAHFYNHSAIVNQSKGTWQQSVVTSSYQFDELIEPEKSENWGGDAGMFNQLISYVEQQDSSFCVLGITEDSHSPFSYGSTHVTHNPEGMPAIMSAYLNSIHHTDSCVGALVDHVMSSPLAQNTMIVITGDHTIFRSSSAFGYFDDYAKAHNINFEAGNTYTPLIIYSPYIDGNNVVDDIAYQMDIFPTILNLIGCNNYSWHGLGISLVDYDAANSVNTPPVLRSRKISEDEAYQISDKLIRSNYFENYQ